MSIAYLSLGSNMGDRLNYLTQGTRRLNEYPGINVTKISSLYKTAAWGLEEQADFYNAVLEIETDLQPMALLKGCQKIEYELERTREIHWGPRTLDIDILLYEGVQLSREALIIPHKYLLDRPFVTIPLAEIAPEVEVNGVKVSAVAEEHARQEEKCSKLVFQIEVTEKERRK